MPRVEEVQRFLRGRSTSPNSFDNRLARRITSRLGMICLCRIDAKIDFLKSRCNWWPSLANPSFKLRHIYADFDSRHRQKVPLAIGGNWRGISFLFPIGFADINCALFDVLP